MYLRNCSVHTFGHIYINIMQHAPAHEISDEDDQTLIYYPIPLAICTSICAFFQSSNTPLMLFPRISAGKGRDVDRGFGSSLSGQLPIRPSKKLTERGHSAPSPK